MEKAGLPYPEFQDVSFMLNVTFHNGLSSTKRYLANVVDDKSVSDDVINVVVDKIKNNIIDTIDLNQTEKDSITILRQKPESSAKEIAAQLNKNQRTIQRHTIALKEKGKLKRVGSDRRGEWIIIE